MRWFLELRPELEEVLKVEFEIFQKRFVAVDELLQSSISHFVPYNRFRRSFRDRFPDSDRFWWWHIRADCDLKTIYEIVDGKEVNDGHMGSCADCQKLLQELLDMRATLQSAKGMPEWHPKPEELVGYFHGTIDGNMEQGVEFHLKLCERCAGEMEMLRQADDFYFHIS